jgi:hypothetical protein
LLTNAIKIGADGNNDGSTRNIKNLENQSSFNETKRSQTKVEAQSTISSPQKSQLSPKSSNSKVFKQSFAKLGVELKNKLEKDWE